MIIIVTHPFIMAMPPASQTSDGLSSSGFNRGWGSDSGARGVDSKLSVVHARRRTRDV